MRPQPLIAVTDVQLSWGRMGGRRPAPSLVAAAKVEYSTTDDAPRAIEDAEAIVRD